MLIIHCDGLQPTPSALFGAVHIRNHVRDRFIRRCTLRSFRKRNCSVGPSLILSRSVTAATEEGIEPAHFLICNIIARRQGIGSNSELRLEEVIVWHLRVPPIQEKLVSLPQYVLQVVAKLFDFHQLDFRK